MKILCEWCQRPFERRAYAQRFCGVFCRNQSLAAADPPPRPSDGATGAPGYQMHERGRCPRCRRHDVWLWASGQQVVDGGAVRLQAGDDLLCGPCTTVRAHRGEGMADPYDAQRAALSGASAALEACDPSAPDLPGGGGDHDGEEDAA